MIGLNQPSPERRRQQDAIQSNFRIDREVIGNVASDSCALLALKMKSDCSIYAEEVATIKMSACAFVEIMNSSLTLLEKGMELISGDAKRQLEAELTVIKAAMDDQEKFFEMYQAAVRLKMEGETSERAHAVELRHLATEAANSAADQVRSNNREARGDERARLEIANDFEIKKLERELEKNRDNNQATAEQLRISRRRLFWWGGWL